MRDEPKLRHVTLWICEACIRGEGQECHTPGCALYLHRVDLPIPEELLETRNDALTDSVVAEMAKQIVRLTERCDAYREATKVSLMALCAMAAPCEGATMHPNMRKDVEFAIEACRAALASPAGEQK